MKEGRRLSWAKDSAATVFERRPWFGGGFDADLSSGRLSGRRRLECRTSGLSEPRDLYPEPIAACPIPLGKTAPAKRHQCFSLCTRSLDHGAAAQHFRRRCAGAALRAGEIEGLASVKPDALQPSKRFEPAAGARVKRDANQRCHPSSDKKCAIDCFASGRSIDGSSLPSAAGCLL